MENKRGNGSNIFLGVIGVATLVVAIIGATFAWFSATANSADDAVNVGSTTVELNYNDKTNTLLKSNLIPAKEVIASYGGLNSDYIAQTATDGSSLQCVDDNGNSICSIYEFTVTNPTNAAQDLTFTLNVVQNGFTNLKYKIYEGTAKPAEGAANGITYNLAADGINETTSGNTVEKIEDTFPGDGGSETLTAISGLLAGNTSKTYTMLIWIDEVEAKQNDEDAGKSLTAGLTVSTGDGEGITGVIGTVGKPAA